jgi:hypothetical protein
MTERMKKAPIQVPSLEEDRQITNAANADPDATPLTEEQMGQMVPLKALRGRPRLANRKHLCPSDTVLKDLIISDLPVQAGNPGWMPSCASMSSHVLASMQRGLNTAMQLTRLRRFILPSGDLLLLLSAGR